MRLIVTRPEEDSAALIAKLEALDHQAIPCPLLRIVERRAEIPTRPYRAIAVTSANAMRALRNHPALPSLMGLPTYALGRQSAAAARSLGLEVVSEEGGDVAGLAEAIGRSLGPGAGPLLYPSGSATAGDLKGTLEARGFEVERVILYDAQPGTELAPSIIEALTAGTADGVLLYSPRTARIWASLIDKAGLSERVKPLAHYCLSSNVAVALGPGFSTRIARRPDEISLLALLDPQ